MTLRVLLVDDIREVRAMVRTRLVREHVAEVVGEAGTGADAIELAKDLRPDAVVLDLMVPSTFGRELCQTIQEASPESRVVVFTAYASDRAWYEANGVRVVEKEDLDELVRQLVA